MSNSDDRQAFQACEVCFAYALTLNGKCLNCDQAGKNAVNAINTAAFNRLPSLSPLHDTFRTNGAFKKNWTTKR